MSEEELMLVQVGELLSKVARPHPHDAGLPEDVRALLWQLGFPCGELTPREELVARLWAKKRSLLMSVQPSWGDGPGLTPPGAA